MKVRDLNFDKNGEYSILVTYKCRRYDVVVSHSGNRYYLYVRLIGNELPVCNSTIPASHCADANCLISYALN